MTTQTNLDLVWALNGGAGVADPGDTKYTDGWEVEIPTHQHFNFVLQNNSKNILALAEAGSHAWQAEITYQAGARVKYDNRFFTCLAVSTNDTPSTGSAFWMTGLMIGNDLLSNALASRGMHIKEVNPRASSTSWDGNDLTIESKAPIIALNVDGAAKNWALGNVSGELVAVDTDTAVLPDNGSIALTESRVHRLYHEGHKPVQSEISGTIPEAPSDGKQYTRLNAAWVGLPSFMKTGAEGSSQLVSGLTWPVGTYTDSITFNIGATAYGDWFLINYTLGMTGGGTAGVLDLILQNVVGSLGRTGFSGASEHSYIGGSSLQNMDGGIWLRSTSVQAAATMKALVRPQGSTATNATIRFTVTRFQNVT